MGELKYLKKIYDAILSFDIPKLDYWIPKLWQDENSHNDLTRVKPKEFFLRSFERILESKKGYHYINNLPASPLVYCLLLRYTTTFDHNLDEKISLEPLFEKFYETGTILKTFSLLPYLKKLGVDILYLLPIYEIGKLGKKGNLGSPYAYKHPLKIDPRLGEPFLNVSIEEQFKALVEACHFMGIKVVVEFVFRTASLDCDLALEHPEWFYWVEEEALLNGMYKPPQYDDNELLLINQKVQNNDLTNLIPPKDDYKNLFTPPPTSVFKEGDRIIGITKDGKRVTIPYGFADWPPNDVQPLWTDVTYLRYYDHPDYNYIAYNTIRMYSRELIKEGKRVEDLWNFIAEIIPYYIKNFDIDGAMIDMGHAIPNELLSEIISRSRKLKENFIFWEENFSVTEKSRIDGYDATLGYLFFDQAEPSKLKTIISKFEKHQYPLPFFLSPENHNTPRSARFGCDFNKLVYTFNSFLPGIKFILSGFEFCHNLPYNTGLCFTEREIANLPPSKLPLFSAIQFDWKNEHIFETITTINKILHDEKIIEERFETYVLESLNLDNPYIVGYKRILKDSVIYVIGNFSSSEQTFQLENQQELLMNSLILLGDFCIKNDECIILKPYCYLVLKTHLSSS